MRHSRIGYVLFSAIYLIIVMGICAVAFGLTRYCAEYLPVVFLSKIAYNLNWNILLLYTVTEQELSTVITLAHIGENMDKPKK